ncbi:MAG TPA: hypothetical protein VL401_01865 [Alphaproteobacteria bacterium]|jgi:hypothetical protein|nr:hypothetical protein [Alphaproteobacteria bacterium]
MHEFHPQNLNGADLARIIEVGSKAGYGPFTAAVKYNERSNSSYREIVATKSSKDLAVTLSDEAFENLQLVLEHKSRVDLMNYTPDDLKRIVDATNKADGKDGNTYQELRNKASSFRITLTWVDQDQERKNKNIESQRYVVMSDDDLEFIEDVLKEKK